MKALEQRVLSIGEAQIEQNFMGASVEMACYLEESRQRLSGQRRDALLEHPRS
jgi:hypothetical protein